MENAKCNPNPSRRFPTCEFRGYVFDVNVKGVLRTCCLHEGVITVEYVNLQPFLNVIGAETIVEDKYRSALKGGSQVV